MLRVSAKKVLGTTSCAVRFPARLSHERVVDHYNKPGNVGSFVKNDPSVGTGLVGAPAFGDIQKLQIKIDEATGNIIDPPFKTFGCFDRPLTPTVVADWAACKGLKSEDPYVQYLLCEIAKQPPVYWLRRSRPLGGDALKEFLKDNCGAPRAMAREKAATA